MADQPFHDKLGDIVRRLQELAPGEAASFKNDNNLPAAYCAVIVHTRRSFEYRAVRGQVEVRRRKDPDETSTL